MQEPTFPQMYLWISCKIFLSLIFPFFTFGMYFLQMYEIVDDFD